MDGVELIAKERMRQITHEHFSPSHDDEHGDGELALAAVCYASPEPPFILDRRQDQFRFTDAWPQKWDGSWDKRRREDWKLIPNSQLSKKERIRNLIKAGALIAAEIDRLQRSKEGR